MNKLYSRPVAPKPSDNPADYVAIAKWHKGSSPLQYALDLMNKAVAQKAPVDAIYLASIDGTWVTVRDLPIDHEFRIWYEQSVAPVVAESANKRSFKGKLVAPIGALAALDLVTRRHSAFKAFEELCTAGIFHAYQPTIKCRVTRTGVGVGHIQDAGEAIVLADAFDAAMEAAGVPNRAYRSEV